MPPLPEQPEHTSLPQNAGIQKAPPIPSSEWDRVKEPIRQFYAVDKRSMAELVEYMKENYDFHATSQQYFKKFREDGWKFRKNNKRPLSPEPEQADNQRRWYPPPEDQQSRPLGPVLTSNSAQPVATSSGNGFMNPQLPAGFATDQSPATQVNLPGDSRPTIDTDLAMASTGARAHMHQDLSQYNGNNIQPFELAPAQIEQYLAVQLQGTWPQQGVWPQQLAPVAQPNQINPFCNNVDPFQVRFMSGSINLGNAFLQPAPRHKAGNKLRQPIHLAATSGFLDGVKLLIDNDPECVHVLGVYDVSAIWLAAEEGHSDIVELLIKHDVDLNVATTKTQRTAISCAAQNGHRRIVEMLLKAGAKHDHKDADGLTPLWMAAQEGHDQIVKLLLNKGADPNVSWEKNDRRPIHQAAQNGHAEVVRLLLANQEVDVDPRDSDGVTPLWFASQHGDHRVFKMLLERGADKEVAWKDRHRRPIHQAAQSGHIEIVRLLIENKVDIEAKEKEGWSALLLAAQDGFLEVVELLIELLIEKHANIHAESKDGVTALLMASQQGHAEIVKFLLNRGAKSSATSSAGRRPIHQAAKNGHFEIVKLLLNHGPDEVDVQDDDGLRPLTLASQLDSENGPNRLRMMEYLLANGAKVTS